MKKYITLFFAIILLVGCAQKNPDGSYDTERRRDMEVVRIDSCEYIFMYLKLAHKGDCKYCANRRRKELEELVKLIKEDKK